jgi:non-homologous end joining protein Ku
MAMLSYAAEIGGPAAAVHVASHHTAGQQRKVQLAQKLIRSWFSKDVNFADYDDGYRKKVSALIRAKVEGTKWSSPRKRTKTPK